MYTCQYCVESVPNDHVKINGEVAHLQCALAAGDVDEEVVELDETGMAKQLSVVPGCLNTGLFYDTQTGEVMIGHEDDTDVVLELVP